VLYLGDEETCRGASIADEVGNAEMGGAFFGYWPLSVMWMVFRIDRKSM
jgi:hypothetical protein